MSNIMINGDSHVEDYELGEPGVKASIGDIGELGMGRERNRNRLLCRLQAIPYGGYSTITGAQVDTPAPTTRRPVSAM